MVPFRGSRQIIKPDPRVIQNSCDPGRDRIGETTLVVPSAILHQICGGKPERSTDPGDVVDRDVRFTSLNRADEGAMHLGTVSQLLLANPHLPAMGAHLCRENDAQR